MKSKIRYVLSGFVVICAFAGVYKILNNVPVKPDLLDFTGNTFKKTSLFLPCDKSSPSLNIKNADNEKIVINGIASKVTFVEKADPVKSPGFCDDLDLNNSRLVHTASYSMVISETKTGYTLSNFKHLADDESLGGMWFYQK
ncbi:TPA: htdF [Escherichia coli]|nr:htdF [Escherichia coli]